jgi:GNAT superfamily N-acetyltransferase
VDPVSVAVMSAADGDGRIRVVPVTEAPWDDVRTVFGTRGDPATCWCQFFKVDNAAWKAPDARRAFEHALCEQIDAATAGRRVGPGVLAYSGSDDDGWQPVGWAAVEPRPGYPFLLGRRATPVLGDPDDASIWAITCFVVRVGHRRKGVGGALLRGAVDEARRGGATVVEAYPVDTAGEKVSSADLYHGPLSTFESAGFTVSERPVDGRAVVRLAL